MTTRSRVAKQRKTTGCADIAAAASSDNSSSSASCSSSSSASCSSSSSASCSSPSSASCSAVSCDEARLLERSTSKQYSQLGTELLRWVQSSSPEVTLSLLWKMMANKCQDDIGLCVEMLPVVEWMADTPWIRDAAGPAASASAGEPAAPTPTISRGRKRRRHPVATATAASPVGFYWPRVLARLWDMHPDRGPMGAVDPSIPLEVCYDVMRRLARLLPSSVDWHLLTSICPHPMNQHLLDMPLGGLPSPGQYGRGERVFFLNLFLHSFAMTGPIGARGGCISTCGDRHAFKGAGTGGYSASARMVQYVLHQLDDYDGKLSRLLPFLLQLPVVKQKIVTYLQCEAKVPLNTDPLKIVVDYLLRDEWCPTSWEDCMTVLPEQCRALAMQWPNPPMRVGYEMWRSQQTAAITSAIAQGISYRSELQRLTKRIGQVQALIGKCQQSVVQQFSAAKAMLASMRQDQNSLCDPTDDVLKPLGFDNRFDLLGVTRDGVYAHRELLGLLQKELTATRQWLSNEDPSTRWWV